MKKVLTCLIYLFACMTYAEEGFIQAGSETCEVVKKQDSFLWRYLKSDKWRTVDFSSSEFFLDDVSDSSNRESTDCLNVWIDYWKHNSSLSGENFSLNHKHLSKSIFSIENIGTGFYISDNGFFLTNYHVADYLCKIPKTGSFDKKIKCKSGYYLYSFPNRSDYNGHHDYALMRKVKSNKEFIKISTQIPKVGDRIINAGYPMREFNSDTGIKRLQKLKNAARYPLMNSGLSKFKSHFYWDPLSYSTGRISQMTFPQNHFFDGIKSKSSECIGCDPSIISIRSQNERNIESVDLTHFEESISHIGIGLPSAGGNSGSPILNGYGEAIGILHRDSMFTSLISVYTQLDLCNVNNSKYEERRYLAEFLNKDNPACRRVELFCQEYTCSSNEERNSVGLSWIREIMKENRVPIDIYY